MASGSGTPVRPLVLLVAALLVLGSCRDDPRPRVLVVGFDGMDPDVVATLVAQGKLPNLARMAAEGAHGTLRASPPLLSPILWTTIATGKTAEQHRIDHFIARDQRGDAVPVTSRMRRAQTLWTIASREGRSVAVVGWWATWPAEAVRGTIVSDRTCHHFLRETPLPGDEEQLVSPAERLETLRPLLVRAQDVGPADVAPFASVEDAELAAASGFDDELAHLRWLVATTESYRRIAHRLWRDERPDLGMVYFEGTDTAAHLFGHLYRQRELAGELREQQLRYGSTVEAMYRHADTILGELAAACDESTTLVVLSDHGFELGALPDDPTHARDMRRVSERSHRPDGVLYLRGRGVRPGVRIAGATQLDVAPTVLALLGIGAGEDMPGRVLDEALDAVAPPRVATHEVAAAPGEETPGDGVADAEILAKLQSLGYVDAAPRGESSTPLGRRNIASTLQAQGRFEEAAAIYEALIAESPPDGALHASLAGSLGAAGCYPEALAEATLAVELEPLRAAGYHNRAVVLEHQGLPGDAVADYRRALRYEPSHAPSRVALQRLGALGPGRADGEIPARLAEVSDLARRGDYPAALALLDELEALAPELALVQQYRANVAYLTGDRDAAIAALRRGLALEPDNALFRENLERLEAAPAK